MLLPWHLPPLPPPLLLQVSISSRGVLKVTHMLTLAGGATAVLEAQHPLGTLTSQASQPASKQQAEC